MSDNIMDIIREVTTSEDGDPMFSLMDRPSFEVVIVAPVAYSIINSWYLGRIIRKSIKIRVIETKKYPYKRMLMPGSNEMTIKVSVPKDYDTIGNWDLGMFVKINIAMKEMDENK